MELTKTAIIPSYFPAIDCGNVIVMKTPQQLSREAIEDFKTAYKEEFGTLLSDDEVQEMATRLLRFFGILTK